MAALLSPSMGAAPASKEKMVALLPGYKIPASRYDVAAPYLKISPNRDVLAEGIRQTFRFYRNLPLEEFEGYCKAAYGIQTIDNDAMRRLARQIFGHFGYDRGKNPIPLIDIHESAMQCPPGKITLLAQCLFAIYLHDRERHFQKEPGRLLGELVSSIKADAPFLPDAMLDYVHMVGGSSCRDTKRFFMSALEGRALIKTEAMIGGSKVPIYIKGLVIPNSLLAYAPSENAILYIDAIYYGKINFHSGPGKGGIGAFYFSKDDLKIAVENFERMLPWAEKPLLQV